MVSKARVLLGMLVLLLVAGAVIALLAQLRADPFWFQILPIGIILFGSLMAHSLGWFDKKDKGPAGRP